MGDCVSRDQAMEQTPQDEMSPVVQRFGSLSLEADPEIEEVSMLSSDTDNSEDVAVLHPTIELQMSTWTCNESDWLDDTTQLWDEEYPHAEIWRYNEQKQDPARFAPGQPYESLPQWTARYVFETLQERDQKRLRQFKTKCFANGPGVAYCISKVPGLVLHTPLSSWQRKALHCWAKREGLQSDSVFWWKYEGSDEQKKLWLGHPEDVLKSKNLDDYEDAQYINAEQSASSNQ